MRHVILILIIFVTLLAGYYMMWEPSYEQVYSKLPQKNGQSVSMFNNIPTYRQGQRSQGMPLLEQVTPVSSSVFSKAPIATTSFGNTGRIGKNNQTKIRTFKRVKDVSYQAHYTAGYGANNVSNKPYRVENNSTEIKNFNSISTALALNSKGANSQNTQTKKANSSLNEITDKNLEQASEQMFALNANRAQGNLPPAPGNPLDKHKLPIGDGLPFLLLLGVVYAFFKFRKLY